MKDKIMIVSTHSEDDPERATIPFVLGLTALSSDMEAVILLQITGVYMAKKEFAKNVREPAFPPAKDLMDQFIAAGGKILVCNPCMKKRGIEPADLIEGVTVVNAPTIVKELGEAKNVVSY
jgi:predicted peroxiredoxin